MRVLVLAGVLWNIGVWRTPGVLADLAHSNAMTQEFTVNVVGPILYGLIDVCVTTLLQLGLAFDC